MIDLCLRTETEVELKAVLSFAVSAEGKWIVASPRWAFDPIGAVVVFPAVVGPDGEVIDPAVVDARFHANLRLLDATLESVVPIEARIEPLTPSRVWA